MPIPGEREQTAKRQHTAQCNDEQCSARFPAAAGTTLTYLDRF